MLRLDAELNKDIIIELKKPLGKLYPDFEDAILPIAFPAPVSDNILEAFWILLPPGEILFNVFIFNYFYSKYTVIDD